MKDKNGTNIRTGTYIICESTLRIYKVYKTTAEECKCCWYLSTSCVYTSDGSGRFGSFTFGDLDMENVLVIPRRLCSPKFRMDQIKLYAALAGMEVSSEETT